jgi:GNAT superfamily N-acetyltransferase
MLEIDRAGVKDHGIVTGFLLDFSDTQGWTPEADHDRWDRVLAELLNSDGWLFLLAREEGEPVGLAAVNWYLTLYGSREQGRVAALIVEETHRRLGIGTRLMESALAAARRRGCRELEASVNSEDEAVASFFRKYGYSGEQKLLTWPCAE